LLALKILNRSLKSELTNITALYSPGVNDQFPRGVEPHPRLQALPESNIEGSVQIRDLPSSHHHRGG
jgi:hypothetical protein